MRPDRFPSRAGRLLFLLLATTAFAEDLYVTPHGGGTRDGTSWSNAFAGLGGVAWGAGPRQVGEGDTLWLAGGNYTSPLVIGASGAPGARICVRRVTAADAVPVAAPGWDPAFDRQAVIAAAGVCIYFTKGIGSYVTIDGRSAYGIKCLFGDNGSGVEIDDTPGTITDITLIGIEAVGPGPIVQTGDTRAFDFTVTGLIANLRLSHCAGRNCDTVFQLSRNTGLIVEHCRFSDAYALNAERFHPNTMFLTETTRAIIRFNRLFNIRVEGLFFESGENDDVQIYGNLFYEGNVPRDTGRGIEFGDEATGTNFRIYNNTFVGLSLHAMRFSGTSHTGCVVENNIFFETPVDLSAVTHDYNLFSGPTDEPHGIGHAPNPFVNSAAFDFQLLAATGKDRARNNARPLPAPFDVDARGSRRGLDGAWDIGAFEFVAPNAGAPAPTLTGPTLLAGTYRTPFSPVTFTADYAAAFGLSGPLPPGLVFAPATATLSGTPTEVGRHEFTLFASGTGGTTATIVTLLVEPRPVGVDGIVVRTRVFDGGVIASLDPSAAALRGILPEDSTGVALDLTRATATFATPGAGRDKPVRVTNIRLTGPAAARYFVPAFTLNGEIVPATATVNLTGLAHRFDGTPRAASATTAPPGLPTIITYAGSGTAPIAPGLHAVAASIVHPDYRGSATGILSIAGALAAAPVITSPPNAVGTVGLPFSYTLTVGNEATRFAAPALPAPLVIDAGTGRITGQPTAPGVTTVTLTATNAAGTTQLPLQLTFQTAGPRPQTLAFPAPEGPGLAQPIALRASASSGLPVAYALLGGNARLQDASLTLFDTNPVIVRALQPGGEGFAAVHADLTLQVAPTTATPLVFFGALGPDLAALVASPDLRSATLFAKLSDTGEALVLPLAPGPDGTFTAVAPGTALPPRPRTLRGRIWNDLVSGRIVETGVALSASLQPPVGPTAALARAYSAPVAGTAFGEVHLVVGPQGIAFTVCALPSFVVAGFGPVDARGGFRLQASDATLTGTVTAAAPALAGTIQLASGPAAAFASRSPSPSSAQRLGNLSTRALVGPQDHAIFGGFSVQGDAPVRVLIRGIGPGLAAFGVAGTLPDPQLKLYRGETLIAQNDDWRTPQPLHRLQFAATAVDLQAAAESVGAFPLPSGSRDAALLVTLLPAAYTTMLSGADAGTGLALIEIYPLPAP